MFDFISEALETPAFWILGGLGVIAEVLGFIIAKKSDLAIFPIWQFAIVIVITLLAAAFFATRD